MPKVRKQANNDTNADSEAEHGIAYTYARLGNPKARAFLRAYDVCGTISAAANASKCNRNMHQYWMRHLDGYPEAFQASQDQFNDSLEELAYARVQAQKPSDSPLLLITLLNAHKPEKYRRFENVDDNTAKELRSELAKLRREWREKRTESEADQGEAPATPNVIRMSDRQHKTG